MKFSEYIALNEANEQKVAEVFKKKMQPAIDKMMSDIDQRLKNWNISGKASIDVKVTKGKDTRDREEYEMRYVLSLPRGLGVEDAKDFRDNLRRYSSELKDYVNKICDLPFFSKRWYFDIGTMEISGRGPWEVAIIRILEKENYRELDVEARERYKDEDAFEALQYMIDELKLYKDGADLLKYAKKAGRVSPELVKEAKALAKAIVDFKKRAGMVLKKLA